MRSEAGDSAIASGYELQPFFRIVPQLLRFLRLAHVHAAYFAFQAVDRVLGPPTSRATSSTFRPASCRRRCAEIFWSPV